MAEEDISHPRTVACEHVRHLQADKDIHENIGGYFEHQWIWNPSWWKLLVKSSLTFNWGAPKVLFSMDQNDGQNNKNDNNNLLKQV